MRLQDALALEPIMCTRLGTQTRGLSLLRIDKVYRARAEKKRKIVKMRTITRYGHKEQKQIARGEVQSIARLSS